MKADPKSESSSMAAEDAQSQAERLSAWLDGELDEAAAGPLVRQLLSTEPLQRKYRSWCLVGDALRSQEVAAKHSPELCGRIYRALQDEPALLAPRALGPRVRYQLASGVAVAAAMVVLVVVAVPLLRSTGAPAGLVAEKAAVPTAVRSELATREAGSLGAVAAEETPTERIPRLDPYLQAHRDFTAEGVMPAAAIYLRSGSESDR